jgi:enoyl-CoA hydratase/carnithine racemase
MMDELETVKARAERGVLFAEISAPPMNLIGPALLPDLVTLIQQAEADDSIQVVARLVGRARALEIVLSAEDYPADLAERYGWINRALPAAELPGFVHALAQRVAGFPADGQVAIKRRVTRLRWPFPKISAGIPISLAHSRALRKRKDEQRSR